VEARHGSRADCQLGYDFRVHYERVCIGVDGRISSTNADPRRRVIEQPAEYRAYEGPAGAVLLTRLSGGASALGHVLMMGEIVSRTTVVELMNVVTSTNWRGELHVVGLRGRRVLTIDHGALKHAQTDFESERLGEILVAAGIIERKTLELYLPQKPKDRRLGQLLVERGAVAAEELFKQLQRQAETIFYASLLVESGHYWFVSPAENAPAPPTTVHVPVQALLMEGVQRIDEMALYRERIPHNRMFPAATEPRPSRSGLLDATTLALLERCDGTRTIDELARLSALGEFQTLKTVYSLLRTGHAQLLSGPTLDTRAAERMVRLFNDIMRDIFLAVGTYGKMEHARRSLSSWLAGGPHTSFLGDELDVDGTLEVRALIRRLEEQGQGGEALRSLHQALHELIAYALFTASNSLPRQEEQSLSRDVNHRLKQLKL
jgi:hypothetical protein